MNPMFQIEKLAKLAAYMLGRRPDEFGLVLDHDGCIAIKEFLKAVNELEGWRHIRQNHLNEILLSSRNPTIEIDQQKIRARDRRLLPQPLYCPSPPKLLHISISQKSYPAVSEHGIKPTFHSSVVCAGNKELAETMGKRRGNPLVMLTIHTARAMEKHVRFHQYGEAVFLADVIPPECFTGPPLPKEKPQDKPTDSMEAYRRQTQAGSFEWPSRGMGSKTKDKKNETNWKRDKKRLRREKKNFWQG
jgi:putative RNA 2'-phosphotransferase